MADADKGAQEDTSPLGRLKKALGVDHTPVMGEKNPANKGALKEAGIDDGAHSSNESSNTGPAGQSTDSYNKY